MRLKQNVNLSTLTKSHSHRHQCHECVMMNGFKHSVIPRATRQSLDEPKYLNLVCYAEGLGFLNSALVGPASENNISERITQSDWSKPTICVENKLVCFLTKNESHCIYPGNQVNGVVVEWTEKVLDTVRKSLEQEQSRVHAPHVSKSAYKTHTACIFLL